MFKIIVWIQSFLKKIRRDRVAAYTGQSAYFIVLSALPFFLFILTLIQHLALNIDSLIGSISVIVPAKYMPGIQALLYDIHVDTGGTLMSLSVIVTIWTAAKGIMAVTDGLNSIQEIEEHRNYFLLRFKAACYTLLFAMVIIFTVFGFVFGNRIYSWIRLYFPNMPDFSQVISILRSFFSFGFYLFIFTLFYRFLPAKKLKVIHQIPGALFTTFGWMISSYIFSLYVDHSVNHSYMYGSLSYLILFFIYLYILMYIFFLGAEINFHLFSPHKQDFKLKY